MEVPTTTMASADARWHDHAACADAGPDGFYDRPRTAGLPCAACPAAEPCLWAALALEQIVGYRHGVWGGTTPARRARIAAGLPEANLAGCYLAVVDAWTPTNIHAPTVGTSAA